MKLFLACTFSVLLTHLALAAPYVVYSGPGGGGDFTANGPSQGSPLFYVIADVAAPSNFAVLQIDTASKLGHILARPVANPTADETDNNFFGAIMSTIPLKGMALFRYNNSITDYYSNTTFTEAYATGPLTLKNFLLVPPRLKPLTVNIRTNGVPNGNLTFGATPVITSGNNPVARTLTGAFFNYEVSANGELGQGSTHTALTLTENPTLTALANIGGSYTSGKFTSAVQPVTIPLSGLETDAFTTWLTNFAQAAQYIIPVPYNGGDGGGTITVGNGPTGTTQPINNGSGNLTVPSNGTLVITSGYNVLADDHTFTFTGATFTVGAVHGGLVDGTLALVNSPITVTDATLLVDGVNGASTLAPGHTLTGSLSLKGGVLTTTSGILTDAGSTITFTATP